MFSFFLVPNYRLYDVASHQEADTSEKKRDTSKRETPMHTLDTSFCQVKPGHMASFPVSNNDDC